MVACSAPASWHSGDADSGAPAQRFGGGVTLADGAIWPGTGSTLGLALAGWQVDGEPRPLRTGPPRAAGTDEFPELLGRASPVAAYDHGDLTGWFAPASGGVELGWNVTEIEGRTVSLDVEIVGAVDGEGDALAGWLEDEEGARWSVSAVRAWDATGRDLPVAATLDAEQLRIEVDAAAAILPIVIDPIVSTATSTWTGGINQYFGYGVAMNGSFDGDAVDDLLNLGHYSTAGTSTVYVYQSAAGSGPGSTVFDTITAPASGAAPKVIAYAGDVNADGYDDVILGDYRYNAFDGGAWLYYGSASGFASSPDVTFSAAGTNDYQGYSVAGRCDINADGYDDVIIGAYLAGSGIGAAYVHYGSSSGVSSTVGTTLTGTTASGYFGYSVACAGDVDADGFDDVIVSARGTVTTGGTAKVFLGSATGVSTTASVTMSASAARDYFGESVSTAGDLNGDGYDDVMIGATNAAPYTYVRICYGSSAGVSSTGCSTVTAAVTSASLGSALASLGDLDGDGYDEVALGAELLSSGTGAVYVYDGSSTGISSTADTTLSGPGTSSYFGCALSGGDADGDGVGDLAVGAYYYSTGQGQVTYYSGEGDADGDGVPTATDCDDSDATVGAAESKYADADGDGYGAGSATSVCPSVSGYATSGGDCKDTDASINPGATETVADGIDQDCDSGDTCYADADRDRYTDGSTTVDSADLDCMDAGEAGRTVPTGECDDSDASVHPGATEAAGDEIDSDCDDAETCYTDADADGYRPDATSTTASSDTDCDDSGEAVSSDPTTDCDDTNASAHPGGAETDADGVDGDCDGEEVCYVDSDDDGYRITRTSTSSDGDCADAGEAVTTDASGDCDDSDASINPGASETIADEVDADCDGAEVCYADADDDGYREESGGVVDSSDTDCSDAGEALPSEPGGDCDDDDGTVFPGRPEICNGVDDDCDGAIDSPDPIDGATWYEDADGDGYTTTGTTTDCEEPEGYSEASELEDCDDGDASIHPGATDEGGNGVDEDCNGSDEDSSGSSGGSSGGGTDSGSSGGGTGSGSSGGSSSGGSSDDDDDDDLFPDETKAGCTGCSAAPGHGSGPGLAIGLLVAIGARRKIKQAGT